MKMRMIGRKVVLSLVTIALGGPLATATRVEADAKDGDLSKGKKIFTRHCAGCHGPAGKGDGYLLLGPEPANLTRPAMKKMSDVALLSTIHDGKPNMPSWKTRLSEEDSRAVLAYIRTLKK
jgi:mono/diheme cytochrome c family protein